MTSLKVGDLVELRAGTRTVAGQTWTWWCEGACRSASAPSRSCRNSLSLPVPAAGGQPLIEDQRAVPADLWNRSNEAIPASQVADN